MRAAAAMLMAAAIALGAAPAAGASVRSCPSSTFVRGRLAGVATVLSVRDMRCRTALSVVRRHGRSARPGGVSSHFRLGAFRCRVYFVLEEDNKARCVDGHRAFRVDYGS